ncbi:NUDIX hydrolase [Persicobacter diffluens]
MASTQPKDQMHFCPKCGGRSFPFEGKKFQCDSCDFTLYINSSCAVAALILNEKGELLLSRRKFAPLEGTLDLPGGFVDPMESAEEAIRREIKEELNLEIVKLDFFCSVPNEYIFKGLSYYTTDITFICKVDSFTNMHVMDDISEALFIQPLEIDLKEVGAISMKKIIQQFQQHYITELQ